jgi:nicotinamide-nucleotide amidase
MGDVNAMSPEDLFRLAERLGAALQARRLWLVTAESCTAGGVAHAVTQIAGSSGWFDRGFITYSNAAKRQMLHVTADDLREFGAVSEPVARAMAQGALAASDAHLAVAVTGIAGPGGGSEAKPVGTVCFCWTLRRAADMRTRTQTLLLPGDRAEVRSRAIIAALEGSLQMLAENADV